MDKKFILPTKIDTILNMINYKNSPIRIDKIKEIVQKLKDIELDQKRKLTPREKIYHIFAYRFKHFDTEEEEQEKGVSLRELALILYPNKITVKEMIVGEKDEHVFSENVWPIIQNTRQSINRFKRWQNAISEENDTINEIGFNLYCLRTRKGQYYYYNLMNEKDLDIVEKHQAKISLGVQKSLNKALDILEMRPEERAENQRKIMEEIEAIRKQNMKKAKTWDGKSKYSDIDFTGINLKDSLEKKE
jgi:hypothetical protein